MYRGMNGILTQLEEVKQLMRLKHQPGHHDQKKHDPYKDKGAPTVTPDRAMVAKFTGGKLNNRLYHVTAGDYLVSIAERGLVPGASSPTGQTWKAKHSDYATYFHSDSDAANYNAKQVEELVGYKPPIVIVDVPITEEYAKRIIPDEDASFDTNKGLQMLARSDAVALIGGAEPDTIWGFRLDPRDPEADRVAERLFELGYEVEIY